MGMFDTIRSSYDLGPGFWNKELQTKDLTCTLSVYWISPNGELFEIDYSELWIGDLILKLFQMVIMEEFDQL